MASCLLANTRQAGRRQAQLPVARPRLRFFDTCLHRDAHIHVLVPSRLMASPNTRHLRYYRLRKRVFLYPV